jgi:hypothetical protein
MSGSYGPCWLISEELGYCALFLLVFGPIKDARPSCLMEEVKSNHSEVGAVRGTPLVVVILDY